MFGIGRPPPHFGHAVVGMSSQQQTSSPYVTTPQRPQGQPHFMMSQSDMQPPMYHQGFHHPIYGPSTNAPAVIGQPPLGGSPPQATIIGSSPPPVIGHPAMMSSGGQQQIIYQTTQPYMRPPQQGQYQNVPGQQPMIATTRVLVPVNQPHPQNVQGGFVQQGHRNILPHPTLHPMQGTGQYRQVMIGQNNQPAYGNIREALGYAPRPIYQPTTNDNTSPMSQQGPERFLDKRRLDDLVHEVDPNEQLDEDVKDALLQLNDDFIEKIITDSCRLAKHRNSSVLEAKDVQLCLERNFNMYIPGFGTDELRGPKKSCVTEAHKQRIGLIKKTLKKP